MAFCRVAASILFILLPMTKGLPQTTDVVKLENDTQIIKPATDEVQLALSDAVDDQRAVRRACQCVDGLCSCCTGILMQNFVNYVPRQRGCLNITYDPDDFAFAMAVSMNDRVLYKNSISGKNPRPLCIPLPRVQTAKLCVRLSNVYFVGRNLHACIDMEARWQDQQTFQMNFDCIRIGANGVKVLKPEEGGGISIGVPVKVTPAPDEYDEIPAEHPPPPEPEEAETVQQQTEKPVRTSSATNIQTKLDPPPPTKATVTNTTKPS